MNTEMTQFKNILLMLVVAVLFSIFAYSLGNAFIENPKYNDFCQDQYLEKPPMQPHNCTDVEPPRCYGNLKPIIGKDGCIESYACDNCLKGFDTAKEKFNLTIFLFMSILGVLAVVLGLTIHSKSKTRTWLLNGFLLGGLISIFFGTVIYFGNAPRWLRPIIMLVELAIVIIVAIKKSSKEEERK